MKFKIKDPGSAITHFIGMLMALFAAAPLLLKASADDRLHLAALSIFIISMILLYAASTIYHTLDISPNVNRILKKIDHMMIFILIAGTYTPICLIVLGDQTGWGLLALVWGIAIAGIVIKACWIYCPKWFSSVLYIAMGWIIILCVKPLLDVLPTPGFILLVAGGVVYTVGAVLYALGKKRRYIHSLWHFVVLGGTVLHFLSIYLYVL